MRGEHVTMLEVKRYRVIDEDHVTVIITLHDSSALSEVVRRAEFGGKSEILAEDVGLVGCFGYGYTRLLLWQDGEVSAAWDFEGPVPLLPEAASILLTMIFWSDAPSASCAVVGGTLLLARVVRCERRIVARDPRPWLAGCQPPMIEELRVTLDNGSRPTWFVASVGYDEGYLYRLALTYDDAVKVLEERGAVLTRELGS